MGAVKGHAKIKIQAAQIRVKFNDLQSLASTNHFKLQELEFKPVKTVYRLPMNFKAAIQKGGFCPEFGVEIDDKDISIMVISSVIDLMLQEM